MKKILMLTTLAFATLQAQDISGDWQGTLPAGGAQLRLALHITKTASGAFAGTMDSLDQGANGIPISSIAVSDSKISFKVDAVHGSYEGKLNAGVSQMNGSWTQGQSIPLAFQRGAVAKAKAAPPSDIDGAWMGTLDAGAMKLRLVFHITNTAAGLVATMDSPDQGAKGIPVTTVTRHDAAIKLEMKQMGGALDGTIEKDLQSIQGTWSQGGQSFPLVLKRVKDQAELDRKRPQNPTRPYPYREEEVSYKNLAADIQLAATFTIPDKPFPVPAVVLISGSGPQDRDETLLGHKPFLVLSDYLTRHGIAVLRADDRGVAKSGGQFNTATTADFATDTEAGVDYLKRRAEVDPRGIGLIGHSEGGIIAPMVAARRSDVAFIVMLAGTGVPGDQVIREQQRLISHTVLDDQQMKALDSPWLRYFLTYDPAVALRKVICPVLVLNGEKDLQVSPEQNLPAIKKALQDAGNKRFEVVELAGLNHLFQTAATGLPSEYGQIEETISPIAMEKMAGWINTLMKLIAPK